MVEKDDANPSYSKRSLGGSLSSRRFHTQSSAAEALLQVYLQTKGTNLLIMLSELQVSLPMHVMGMGSQSYMPARHLRGIILSCLVACRANTLL